MRNPTSITSLPQSPDQERASRMVKYAVTMGIRVVCLIICFFVPGWWMLVPALGAVFLPWIAVLIANTRVVSRRDEVERPGSIIRVQAAPHQ